MQASKAANFKPIKKASKGNHSEEQLLREHSAKTREQTIRKARNTKRALLAQESCDKE